MCAAAMSADLEKAAVGGSIGVVLIAYCDFLRTYTRYVSSYDLSLQVLSNHAGNKKLTAFLVTCTYNSSSSFFPISLLERQACVSFGCCERYSSAALMERNFAVGWLDGWLDGWIDGWLAGWMDGWVDGRLRDRRIVGFERRAGWI